MRAHWSPGFREELRRHTAAVQRSAAVYHAEQETTRGRVDIVRVCKRRGCTTTTRSQTGICKEHR